MEDFLDSYKADQDWIHVFLQNCPLAGPQDILAFGLDNWVQDIQLDSKLEEAEQYRAETELIGMSDCLMHCVDSSPKDYSRHFVDVHLAGAPIGCQDFPGQGCLIQEEIAEHSHSYKSPQAYLVRGFLKAASLHLGTEDRPLVVVPRMKSYLEG